MVENDEDRGGRDAGDVSDEDDRLDAEASDDDDDDEDDDEDSQLASVGGSTLTVKYKARPGSASTGRLSPAATTIDRKSCRSPHPDVLIRRVESRIVLDDSQPCAVLIKVVSCCVFLKVSNMYFFLKWLSRDLFFQNYYCASLF